MLDILLEAGANPNEPDHDGFTFMHSFVLSPHIKLGHELPKVLLDKNSMAGIRDSAGFTFLHHAVLENSPNFEALLGIGLDVHAVDNQGDALIHMLAERRLNKISPGAF
jgi:ankyrin repeat protein